MKSKEIRKLFVPMVCILLGIFIGALLTRHISSNANYSLSASKDKNQSSSKVVNMAAYDNNDPSLTFFRSQITIPDGYFVTDDNMLVSYASQGGMAPPRVILMKGYQLLDEEKYYDAITKNPGDECIAVWTTQGFSKIEDWNSSITQYNGKLTNKETITVGKRNAEMYTLQRKEGNVYVGFLQVGDKDDTTYYFNTCNDKNKQDYKSVIASLKLRGDVNF